jgi:hypothetical protein
MPDEKAPPVDDWCWATPALEQLASGVDTTQIRERLKLTPTERLERMRRFLLSLEQVKQSRS